MTEPQCIHGSEPKPASPAWFTWDLSTIAGMLPFYLGDPAVLALQYLYSMPSGPQYVPDFCEVEPTAVEVTVEDVVKIITNYEVAVVDGTLQKLIDWLKYNRWLELCQCKAPPLAFPECTSGVDWPTASIGAGGSAGEIRIYATAFVVKITGTMNQFAYWCSSAGAGSRQFRVQYKDGNSFTEIWEGMRTVVAGLNVIDMGDDYLVASTEPLVIITVQLPVDANQPSINSNADNDVFQVTGGWESSGFTDGAPTEVAAFTPAFDPDICPIEEEAPEPEPAPEIGYPPELPTPEECTVEELCIRAEQIMRQTFINLVEIVRTQDSIAEQTAALVALQESADGIVTTQTEHSVQLTLAQESLDAALLNQLGHTTMLTDLSEAVALIGPAVDAVSIAVLEARANSVKLLNGLLPMDWTFGPVGEEEQELSGEGEVGFTSGAIALVCYPIEIPEHKGRVGSEFPLHSDLGYFCLGMGEGKSSPYYVLGNPHCFAPVSTKADQVAYNFAPGVVVIMAACYPVVDAPPE